MGGHSGHRAGGAHLRHRGAAQCIDKCRCISARLHPLSPAASAAAARGSAAHRNCRFGRRHGARAAALSRRPQPRGRRAGLQVFRHRLGGEVPQTGSRLPRLRRRGRGARRSGCRTLESRAANHCRSGQSFGRRRCRDGKSFRSVRNHSLRSNHAAPWHLQTRQWSPQAEPGRAAECSENAGELRQGTVAPGGSAGRSARGGRP